MVFLALLVLYICFLSSLYRLYILCLVYVHLNLLNFHQGLLPLLILCWYHELCISWYTWLKWGMFDLCFKKCFLKTRIWMWLGAFSKTTVKKAVTKMISEIVFEKFKIKCLFWKILCISCFKKSRIWVYLPNLLFHN